MPWNEIRSQPLVSNLLKRSLISSRIHHAYLFIGEEAETEPVALAFAQSLNCEKDDADFCGCCGSCKIIAKNQHPDVHSLRPESRSRRILISQVRELERSVCLKADRARAKVAIVHAADRLQPEAQDAFLKTLEEPPPKTIFLLLTEEPQQLKETIVSRCLRLLFRPGKKKAKTPHEKLMENWLEEFHVSSSRNESKVFHACGLAGKVLGLLKEVREEKLKEIDRILDDPSLEHLESSQRERLEEQMAAQAQADYLHERTQLLKAMMEWCHINHAGSMVHQPGFHSFETIDALARRLGRNVNESLAWETAMLALTRDSVKHADLPVAG